MEDLELMTPEPRKDFWRGRRVLVTGHTGFIGGWLARTLVAWGARVSGYANAVPTTPSFFETAGLSAHLNDYRGDIADRAALSGVVEREEPEIVFHLAAQPLVRRAHREPLETYRTNVLGTIAVLDALRLAPIARAAVLMTTDKVYRNREWAWPYREDDVLGGHEPYGVSKAMAELAIAQYRETYSAFAEGGSVRLVSVRAGNVIGGGDWSEDRLVPDAVRAWQTGRSLEIRSPGATRPWQHVMDVVGALTLLAERALDPGRPQVRAAYNVGPDSEAVVPVARLCELLSKEWGTGADIRMDPACAEARESQFLAVDSTLMRADLGWRPRLSLTAAVRLTVAWYKAHLDRADRAADETERQIAEHFHER